MRGLKLCSKRAKYKPVLVAPLVGAWIETWGGYRRTRRNVQSHPSWVRGLKLMLSVLVLEQLVVAPLVGAWIETDFPLPELDSIGVAPLVGAWIETSLKLLK